MAVSCHNFPNRKQTPRLLSTSTMKQAITFLATLIAGVPLVAGQITYRTDPELQWNVRVQSVREGNGVFLSPDEKMLVSSSNLGYVSGFGAKDGSEIFSYAYSPPSGSSEFISSTSGITFAGDYLVYSVLVNKNTVNPLTRVVALSMTGNELWISPSLKGLSSGTPVVSSDGAYVFLTHNSLDGTIGHFTILDGATGEVFHTEAHEEGPFAPLGISHNPAEGYYDGGENNRNDILVWSVQPKPSDASVGPGATFAFQFPIGFSGNAADVGFTKLGDDIKDFQAIQKPVFADDGRTLYWGTTRSQFRCWIGADGFDRYRFNRARTSTIGFSRGTPPMQAVYAAPTLSNDPQNRFIFGGTAATEFVKMSEDFSDEIMVMTGQLVKSTARVSPDDAVVYYLETDGRLHQANTMDLSDKWVLDLGGTTEGEFALNSDGTVLYVGDASGFIQAFRVGDVPTEEPSAVPSPFPTVPPTFYPTANATDSPTAAPTENALSTPSKAPVARPTPATPPTHVKATQSPSGSTSAASGASSYRTINITFLSALLAFAATM